MVCTGTWAEAAEPVTLHCDFGTSQNHWLLFCISSIHIYIFFCFFWLCTLTGSYRAPCLVSSSVTLSSSLTLLSVSDVHGRGMTHLASQDNTFPLDWPLFLTDCPASQTSAACAALIHVPRAHCKMPFWWPPNPRCDRCIPADWYASGEAGAEWFQEEVFENSWKPDSHSTCAHISLKLKHLDG